jgi:hypothetical protein
MDPLLALQLRERWIGQSERIACIVDDLRADGDWTRNLLARADKGWEKLPHVDTCPQVDSPGTSVCVRDLRGLPLEKYDLSGRNGLAGAYLDFCTFVNVDLDGASLIGASFRESQLRNCSFFAASLQFTDFTLARCPDTSFENADLTRAKMLGADLRGSVLVGTVLRDVQIRSEPWYGFVVPAGLRKWTQLGGEKQRASALDSRTAPDVAQQIADAYGRWKTRRLHPVLGGLWYVMSDCGLSPGRFVVWLATIWLLFACVYASFPLPQFLQDTMIGNALVSLCANIQWDAPSPCAGALGPLCLSAAAMTGLGFKDFLPPQYGILTSVYACAESVLGIVLLGVFITLFLQRWTRAG